MHPTYPKKFQIKIRIYSISRVQHNSKMDNLKLNITINDNLRKAERVKEKKGEESLIQRALKLVDANATKNLCNLHPQFALSRSV